VAKLGLHFPLLSDADMRVVTAYGVAMKGRDIAVPSVYVVRQNRTIAFHKVGETVGDRASPDEVVAQVTAAR
jgi:peroxiredoxin